MKDEIEISGGLVLGPAEVAALRIVLKKSLESPLVTRESDAAYDMLRAVLDGLNEQASPALEET